MAGGAHEPDPVRPDELVARWPHRRREGDDALLERARRGASLLLVGDPGIGKTTLAAWLLGARRCDGAHVVEAGGSEGCGDVPLGALRAALAPPDGVALSQLHRWALQRLVQLADGAPLVLGVDDAHHLDPLSAAIVHQLVATGQATAILTARSADPLPDAIERLERDGHARRTILAPLVEAEVRSVLEEALDGPATTSTVRALTEASGGNALHLRELCAHGIEQGALRSQAGRWAWHGPMHAGDGLRRLLLERVADLDPAASRAVELLAFADVLGMEVCERLVGTDAIDRLERRRLIAVDRAGRRDQLRLAHPLVGEVVRDSCGDRSGLIWAALADAAEEHGCRRAGDLARVAEWRLAAGQRVGPEPLMAAATQAAAAFDPARAERLASAAVAAGGGAAAALTLGAVLVDVGRAAEAEQVWAAIDLPPGDPLLVPLAIARAENLFFGLDRPAAAAALLDDAAEHAVGDAHTEQVTVKRAMLELYDGHPSAARRTVAPLADSGPPSRIRAATVFLGPALAMEGRCTEAIAAIDAALALHDDQGDEGSLYKTGELLAGRVLALCLGGRLRAAERDARGVLDLSAAIGAEEGVALFGLAAGHAALLQGDVAAARRDLEDAAVLLRQHDPHRYLPWCMAELAHARLLAGEVDGATDALVEAVRSRRAAFRLLDPRLDLARARFAAATGRVDDGIKLALAAGRRSADTGQLVFAAQLLHEALRAACATGRPAPDGVASRLAALADATDSALVAALADHGAAAERDDGAALHDAAAAVGALGARIHAAEALQLASAAHHRHGDALRAVADALAARSVASSCAGAAPGWLGPLPALELLSARELEVVELTARGLSTRAVAEALYVSVRTVENHLHRAYAKLGARGREEVAAVLAPALDLSEWRVAHDVGDEPSYVPAPPRSLEVAWLGSP